MKRTKKQNRPEREQASRRRHLRRLIKRTTKYSRIAR